MQEQHTQIKHQQPNIPYHQLTPANYLLKSPYKDIFLAIENDQSAQKIFTKNLKSFLCSKHPQLQHILQYSMKKSKINKKYFKIISEFLSDYFSTSQPLCLQESLQQFLIMNLWREEFRRYRKYLMVDLGFMVGFLSLKMRSLEPNIRIYALDSMYQMLNSAVQSNDFKTLEAFRAVLPQTIEKENLGKNMSSSRGVFLQILEDEICKIKIKGIKFLGSASSFYDINILRPLVLYMLNDEHQEMRQTSLRVLSKIQAFELEKQDLRSLLVCLRENNIGLRNCVYENLLNIKITSQEDFYCILEKIFSTLLVYKIDKKKIYHACHILGQKYPEFVLGNLSKIYQYSEIEEPNWKNLIYKAKVITVASIGKQKWPNELPIYFRNHFLYIRDIEFSSFRQQLSPIPSINFDIKIENLFLSNKVQLQHFLAATFAASLGFPKKLLKILQQLLYFQGNLKILPKIYSELLLIGVSYNIEAKVDAFVCYEQIKGFFINYEQNLPYLCEKIKNIAPYIFQNPTLNSIPEFIFKVSGYDNNCIIITKNSRIIRQSFIEFQTKKQNLSNHPISSSFMKMSQIDYAVEQDNMYFYQIEFKWRKITCFVLYGDEMLGNVIEKYVTDKIENNE